MELLNLQLTQTDAVALISISRPKAMNALNTQVFKELEYLLHQLRTNNSVRVVVITGEGKAFVAGADIAEMVNKNPQQAKEFSLFGQKVFDMIDSFPLPVIAAVNGYALGGGCELAMACDFRIASINAKFGQPEVNLGLIPGYAGTQRLPRLVGKGMAMFMLLTGEMINANEALQCGLVQRVTTAEELMTTTMHLAQTIASKGKLAVRKLKEVVRKGSEMSYNFAVQAENEAFASLFDNPESKEGMTAFLEKRTPNW